jgi:hypothetical protein
VVVDLLPDIRIEAIPLIGTLGGYRLTAIGIFLLTVVPQWQHVPAKPTRLLSSFRIWRAGATCILSLSPPSYVVNEGGKGGNPRFAYRSGACKYTTACEHASMSSPDVLWPTRCHWLQIFRPFASLYSASFPPYFFLPLSLVIR